MCLSGKDRQHVRALTKRACKTVSRRPNILLNVYNLPFTLLLVAIIMRSSKKGTETKESANLDTMITAGSPGWFDGLEPVKPKPTLRRLEDKKDDKKEPEQVYPINFSKLCKDKNNY